MPENTAKTPSFWQELKRRNVIHVMTVYIAVAFGFLEGIDIISGPLNLPGWVISVVMILAVAGFPVAFLSSWLIAGSPDMPTREKPEDGTPWEDVFHSDLEQDLDKTGTRSVPDDTDKSLAGFVQKSPNNRIGRARVQMISITSIVVIAAAIVLFLFYSGKSVPFRERGWIVITDFENTTGEEIFDHSLNAAFALSINQSRYINVIPRQRMYEAIKRMKLERLEYIDEVTGREIAMREGVDVFMVPGISRVGSQYVLTFRIQEAKTGTIFKSEVLYAKNQDEILEKLDKLTKKIRRNLGESRYQISGQDKPLYKVTTSSLDALKQFSLGLNYHLNMEFGKAVIHYKNAIEIDSGFTSAKASLGNILFEKFDREKGRQWLDQAIRSVNDLTDNEKYSILAFYAVNIENDLEKGIEYTRTIIDLYPDDPTAYHNLGWYCQQQGKYAEAAKEYRAALRIDPNMMLTMGGLIWIYLEYVGQMDSALIWSEKMIDSGPENPWGYYYLGSAYAGSDDLAMAESQYGRARELDPGFSFNLYRLAHVYGILGQHDKAIETLQDILQKNPAEAMAQYYLGINYHNMGDAENARKHFTAYLENVEKRMEVYPENPWIYFANALVLTHLGKNEAGWEMGKRGLELDSTFHFHMAELLAAMDRKREALNHFEKALETGYRNLVWIKLNPDIHLLAGEDRYQALVSKYFP